MTNVATALKRIAAIDVLRALTMVWMLFVNDIPGLDGVPHWLFHAKAGEDMLGFSDLVFPAFLFCVGMSIPFALEGRLKRGASMSSTIGHVLLRTLALVVMGLFMMNCDEGAGHIPYPTFSLLMTAGFFLIWTDYPRQTPLFRLMKIAGVILLASMLIYSDVVGQPFHTGWWGILGLIGWTYVVCAGTYLLVRGHWRLTLTVWIVFVLLCVLNQTELIPYNYFSRVVLLPFIPGGWVHHALGFSGVVASLLLKRLAGRGQQMRLIGIFVALGVACLLLGVVAHHWWIVSKIFGTPTWLFFSLAVNFGLLALVYWITDVCGRRSWFDFIAPAGTATLTCYLISYIWYPLRSLLGIFIPGWYGFTGILISLAYALIVVLLTRLLVRLGVKVKL